MPRDVKFSKAEVNATRAPARNAKKKETSSFHTFEKELTEALEQQSATSEILRVISSSPKDLQPVFDTIAERAVRLCGAELCHVFRFDGDLLHFVAHHRLELEGVEAVRRFHRPQPGAASQAGRSSAAR